MTLLDIANDTDTIPASPFSTEPPTGTLPARALAAYSKMITEGRRLGYSAYLLTVMFRQLQGPKHVVKRQMLNEVERIYSTFVTHVVRKAKTAPTDKLPILIGSLDLPVPKKNQSKKQLVH